MYYTTVTCQLSIHGNELCIVFSVNDVLCYSAWQGPFYPLNLENSKWLSYYSQVFDFVEIDSSFYRIPNEFMVRIGAKRLLTILDLLPNFQES
jgi:hypothetical protein